MLRGLCTVAAVVALAAAARAGEAKVEFSDIVEIADYENLPAVLSPDGKRVLLVKPRGGEGEAQKHAYVTVSVADRKEKELLVSTVGEKTLLGFVTVPGVWSPKGDRVALLTTSDGKPFGTGRNVATVIADADGKTAALPAEKDQTVGAVFGPDGAVYYVDGFITGKDEKTLDYQLRRLRPDGKAETLLGAKDEQLLCLAMSSDGSKLGGLILRVSKTERTEGIVLWAYDLKSGKTAASGLCKIKPGRGLVRLFWACGGTVLCAHGRQKGVQDDAYCLLTFEPFAPEAAASPEETREYEALVGQLGSADFGTREAATAKLSKAGRRAKAALEKAATSADAEVKSRAETLLAACTGGCGSIKGSAGLIGLGELAPGMLSVTGRSGDEDKRCYLLDAATGEKTEYAPPYLLVEAQGETGLFLDLEKKKYVVAKFKLTRAAGKP